MTWTTLSRYPSAEMAELMEKRFRGEHPEWEYRIVTRDAPSWMRDERWVLEGRRAEEQAA